MQICTKPGPLLVIDQEMQTGKKHEVKSRSDQATHSGSASSGVFELFSHSMIWPSRDAELSPDTSKLYVANCTKGILIKVSH
jgi:hypothetical protein